MPREQNFSTRLYPAGQVARSVNVSLDSSKSGWSLTCEHVTSQNDAKRCSTPPVPGLTFGIPVLLTSCQKGPQKGPWNWSPMCSLCSLTSLFEVFCLEPSKSWFQTTSRQNAVSWVHGTFAEINYYPDGGAVGNISSKPCTNVRSASRKNTAAPEPANRFSPP